MEVLGIFLCYYRAISKKDNPHGSYEYMIDENLCIVCSFCADRRHCGVWEMVENV